jgi:hypothetical protein
VARWHVPPASIAIAAIDQAEAIMEPEVNRRQPGNSIDYDFYRRRAARVRTEAMREFAKPLRIGLFAAGIVAALLIAASMAHRVYCPHSGDNHDVAVPCGNNDDLPKGRRCAPDHT